MSCARTMVAFATSGAIGAGGEVPVRASEIPVVLSPGWPGFLAGPPAGRIERRHHDRSGARTCLIVLLSFLHGGPSGRGLSAMTMFTTR